MAPWTWRLRNALTQGYLWGCLCYYLAGLFSRVTSIPTLRSKLEIRVRRADGQMVNYGWVRYGRKITATGVGFLVDAWQNSVELEIMKYHGCGTDATAESNAHTALLAECTTTLNPDSTRATGTLAEGASANIFSTVGTLTFDGAAVVTEHGLLSQAATGGGVLWDRHMFSAINVASGDSITFTYQCTVSAEA
jgi:hypothetical protein